ncbi:SRPBCC domain-containing protein [Streptacidiphilus sp. ASG 303]|uniref:SRPBCC domain-containing protein n=1 Tax=Streptacidiphilus sp. ASG 303 TaxID=2896847 RepID=UPI001E4AC0CD|nr:SRPBCC domain-containing protein [Streptacidiphilus sp. ASG 303]MCD0483504.1 SRPBCC domain-containing protein [Streptacidiphilus sp. ASG 303]
MDDHRDTARATGTETATATADDRDGFTLTRVFDAPVDTVWRVWTEPLHFARWFGAPLPTVSVDLRPGGAWRATVATPGGEMPVGGVYREVDRHRRLVWTMEMPGDEVVMSADFTDLGDGRTQAVYHQTVGSPEMCDQAREGAEHIISRFADHLATV